MTGMASTSDQYASKVLDVLIEHGGTYDQGDPGEVLGNLAHEAGVPYKAVSLVVLRLEEMGFITVTRWDEPTARRANKVVRIEEA